jgi:hypothetical protein
VACSEVGPQLCVSLWQLYAGAGCADCGWAQCVVVERPMGALELDTQFGQAVGLICGLSQFMLVVLRPRGACGDGGAWRDLLMAVSCLWVSWF